MELIHIFTWLSEWVGGTTFVTFPRLHLRLSGPGFYYEGYKFTDVSEVHITSIFRVSYASTGKMSCNTAEFADVSENLLPTSARSKSKQDLLVSVMQRSPV
jgi:hypothetical protein